MMNTIDVVIEALERAPEIATSLVREAKPEHLKRRPKPDKWSIHEQMCHLAVSHRILQERLDLFRDEAEPHITPYLPSKEDEEGALLEQDLEEAITRFAEDRRRVVERLRGLAPEDFDKTATHDEYSHYTLFIMCRHFALHDLFHAYRIEEILLNREWA